MQSLSKFKKGFFFVVRANLLVNLEVKGKELIKVKYSTQSQFKKKRWGEARKIVQVLGHVQPWFSPYYHMGPEHHLAPPKACLARNP